jgi:hypothetical protein
MTPLSETMQERFDKEFDNLHLVKSWSRELCSCYGGENCRERVKDFIQKEITTAREEERRRVIREIECNRDRRILDYPEARTQSGWNDCINKLINSLEEDGR